MRERLRTGHQNSVANAVPTMVMASTDKLWTYAD